MKKPAKPVKSKPAPKAAKSVSKSVEEQKQAQVALKPLVGELLSALPMLEKPKPPVSLEHCLMARIKYVGWIQALQTDMQFQLDCLSGASGVFPAALGSAYDLLQEHDRMAEKWYGSDYRPEFVVGINEYDRRCLIRQSYEKE